MQEAIFTIFERPCIRLRSLAMHVGIPKSSLSRKLGRLDYVVIYPSGGIAIKGMVFDRKIFNLLERERDYSVILALAKGLSIDETCKVFGVERRTLKLILERIVKAGIGVKRGNSYGLSEGLAKCYQSLLKTLPENLSLLERILRKENLPYKIRAEERIFVEGVGLKREIVPYARLKAILEL